MILGEGLGFSIGETTCGETSFVQAMIVTVDLVEAHVAKWDLC